MLVASKGCSKTGCRVVYVDCADTPRAARRERQQKTVKAMAVRLNRDRVQALVAKKERVQTTWPYIHLSSRGESLRFFFNMHISPHFHPTRARSRKRAMDLKLTKTLDHNHGANNRCSLKAHMYDPVGENRRSDRQTCSLHSSFMICLQGCRCKSSRGSIIGGSSSERMELLRGVNKTRRVRIDAERIFVLEIHTRL